MAFPTEVRKPPQLRLAAGGLSLKDKKVKVIFSAPAQKIEIEVIGEDGATLDKRQIPFPGNRSGTPLNLNWEPKSNVEVMKIVLVAHDTQGFFSPTLTLYPWRLSIPHEEVVFDTASDEIRVSEIPKLKDVLPRIRKRITQYSDLIPVRLFVLGHTDSVGPSDSNRLLSQKRATAIAKWFKVYAHKILYKLSNSLTTY